MESAYRTTPSQQLWTALRSLYLITTSPSQLTNNHSQRLKNLGHRPSTPSKINRFQQLEGRKNKNKSLLKFVKTGKQKKRIKQYNEKPVSRGHRIIVNIKGKPNF